MLNKLRKKKVLYGIGLMSGTSLDGVDVSVVRIENKKNPVFLPIGFGSIPYPEWLKQKILKNSNPQTSNIQEICSLNVELSNAYVKAIQKVLDDEHINIDEIDFIANHGQTMWHNPEMMDGMASSTLQLGDASTISAAFNKLVIYDFRTLDMAYGGSGAPLIPMSEYMLYRSNNPRILLNIGGISNITYMKENANIDDLLAFDTGPGNMLIDRAMMLLYNKPYDEDGLISKKGKICNDILEELLKDEYFSKTPPKSTGREKYSDAFLQNILLLAQVHHLTSEDIIATISAFTALSITSQIEKFIPSFNQGELIVSGGGANNSYLIELLKKYKTKEYNIYTGRELGINPDAKEAIGFAVLGYLRIMNKASNVTSVTGAKKMVSLGSIVLPQEN